jgi:hypothetical protein
MKDKLIELLEKYGKYFVLFCIVVSALGLVLSYLFPNEVPFGVDVNMEKGNEFTIPLTKGTTLEYKCNTGTLPMGGIQVYVSKEGAEFTDGKIIYKVYNSDSSKELASGEQLVKDLVDPQFVYLPFSDKKASVGDITIQFSYEGSEATPPAIVANSKILDKASTLVNGSPISGNIKSSYIYISYTHPLAFDFKVMLAIFVTVFFTLEGKRRRK